MTTIITTTLQPIHSEIIRSSPWEQNDIHGCLFYASAQTGMIINPNDNNPVMLIGN